MGHGTVQVTDPIARLVQNLVLLERLANGLVKESAARVQALIDEIVADLQRIDPAEPIRSVYQRARVEKLIEAAKERVAGYVASEERALRDALAPVGRAQAQYAQVTLTASLGDAAAVHVTPVTQGALRAILTTEPFQGRLLSEHVERVGANVFVRVRDQIRMGMAAEEGIPEMVRRIRGRSAGFERVGGVAVRRFSGGVLETTTREAEALVRTAVNFIANQALRGTYQANDGLLSGIEIVATLDSRTTELCLSLDGTIVPVDAGPGQLPPFHWNCRTITVPVVDWEKLGVEAPPEATRAARNADGKVEQIPSSVKAEEWLRGQPQSVQEKLLGKGKANLFRRGEITLSDLIRQDESVVPLSALEGR